MNFRNSSHFFFSYSSSIVIREIRINTLNKLQNLDSELFKVFKLEIFRDFSLICKGEI